jgi:anti-sigma regulatory factor (Ser/Thr protein kinase)
MRKPRKKTIEIRNFILDNIANHSRDITLLTSDHFDISRPAVLRHIQKLIDEGTIVVHGKTRDRRYELKIIVDEAFLFSLATDVEEDKVWRHLVRPMLKGIPGNVMSICEYGMSEMINNVIDHSEGTEAEIHVTQTAARIAFHVIDNGIGIFKKIQRDLHLGEPRQAILELSKGKLTTDPDRHTGEGIFFASRMFDSFVVCSEGLFFSPRDTGVDRQLDPGSDEVGTTVSMGISILSSRTLHEVFDRYTSDDFEYTFSKTDVPVALATFGDENLVSRSQARRLLARFHEFQEVSLDFSDVDTIGQAFSDEIFRVFSRNNPDIEITTINTNEQIEKMIRRVRSDPQ